MNHAHTDEEMERCTLTGQREIIFQLRTMIRQKERVSVIFDEGRQSFLSVLIEVSEGNHALYFDIGGSDETNTAFLKSERCQFMCHIGGIRIQFSGKSPRIVNLKGEKVFVVPLPANMLRLQRRDAYRLQLPTSKPYICRIRRGTPEEATFPLYDISVSGLGFQVADAPDLEPMSQLENCWLDLHESGMLAVTLEVRYISEKQNRANKPLWHIGCRFINLTANHETLIQRFMARLEAELRALSAG
ncbi:MAG: flagellar brake protein [Betaproteobacteria bacterium]